MNIVIFGCGQAGRMVLNWLPAGNNPVAYADNDPRKWGTYICQVPVIPPSDLLSFQPDLVWIAVVNREASLSIERQLRGLGYHGLIQSLTPLRERLDLRLACLRLLAEQIRDRGLPGAAAGKTALFTTCWRAWPLQPVCWLSCSSARGWELRQPAGKPHPLPRPLPQAPTAPLKTDSQVWTWKQPPPKPARKRPLCRRRFPGTFAW